MTGLAHRFGNADTAGWALSVVAATLVFTANASIGRPLIVDELAYLANASALAGNFNDHASSYRAGYPLLLVPAFLYVHTPENIWIAVKAINAGLFFILVASLWSLAGRLSPEAPLGTRARAVVLVSLYPMWVVMAGYSFAQIAFAPFFVITFIAFLRAIEGGRWPTWGWLGALSGYLFWIHPTGVVILMALTPVCGYVALRRRAYREFAAFLVAVAIALLAYQYMLTPWLQARMTTSGLPPESNHFSASGLLARFIMPGGLAQIATHLGGHIFYLMAGTVGLAAVGLHWVTRNAFLARKMRIESKQLRLDAIAAFLWLVILGSTALSTLLFATPAARRLDQWMYGRYVDGMLAPVLLVGALRPSFRPALWALPFVLIGAALFWAGFDGYSNLAPFNVTAFWQQFVLLDRGILAWALGSALLIAIVALVPKAVGGLVIAVTFACASFMQIDWHEAASTDAMDKWEAAKVIRSTFATRSCVGFDETDADTEERRPYWFDLALILFDYDLRRMTFDQWLQSCDGPLFSYINYASLGRNGIQPIALGTKDGPTLWARGKPAEDRFYPISVADRSGGLAYAVGMGNGWYSIERGLIWSGASASLRLLVPSWCNLGQCKAYINLSIYGASSERPRVLRWWSDTGQRDVRRLAVTSNKAVSVEVAMPSSGESERVHLEVVDSVSPKVLSDGTNQDDRVLGAALFSIDMRPGNPLNSPRGLHKERFEAGDFSQVGRHNKGRLFSTGTTGFLAFGPGTPMAAGRYRLVVRGMARNSGGAWVDVTSHRGAVQHGKFPVKDAPADHSVFAEGTIQLNTPVDDIEVRVYVDAQADIALEGYDLVPLEEVPRELPGLHNEPPRPPVADNPQAPPTLGDGTQAD